MDWHLALDANGTVLPRRGSSRAASRRLRELESADPVTQVVALTADAARVLVGEHEVVAASELHPRTGRLRVVSGGLVVLPEGLSGYDLAFWYLRALAALVDERWLSNRERREFELRAHLPAGLSVAGAAAAPDVAWDGAAAFRTAFALAFAKGPWRCSGRFAAGWPPHLSAEVVTVCQRIALRARTRLVS